VLENGCQCEVGNPYPLKHLTAGWQFVVGEHPNYFPANNIFMLLAQSLPTERVLLVDRKQMLAVYVFQMLDGQDAFLEDLDFQDYRLILSIPSTTVAIVHRIAN
jgi:hypothetical protein